MTRWRADGMGRAGRALLSALALSATPAFADRTSHLFVDETQVLPEGDVELENWVWAQGQIPSSYDPAGKTQYPTTGWIWFGPTVGITNHLEMSLPVVLYDDSKWIQLNSISLVARYRLFPREQDDGLQPLLRVEYQQPLSDSHYAGPPTLKLLLAATYGALTGVRGTVNVGVQLGLPFLFSSTAGCRGLPYPCSGNVSALGTAALAVSVPLGHEFRIAAELDGQLPLGGEPYPNLAQLYLGPSVAWTRGQIWVTFGTLFGLTNNSYRYVPKVLWGITF